MANIAHPMNVVCKLYNLLSIKNSNFNLSAENAAKSILIPNKRYS